MLRGNPPGSTSANRNTDDASGSEDNDDQPRLTTPPVRAYAKRPRSDPLSFPEEINGDGSDPSSEYGLHLAQPAVIHENLNPHFHGESSLLAFANALSEKRKLTGGHDPRSRRREFWETPEVCLSDA